MEGRGEVGYLDSGSPRQVGDGAGDRDHSVDGPSRHPEAVDGGREKIIRVRRQWTGPAQGLRSQPALQSTPAPSGRAVWAVASTETRKQQFVYKTLFLVVVL